MKLQEPNVGFFENYHSKKDENGQTLLDLSQFLVVRHALSHFNVSYRSYKSLTDPSLDDFLSYWASPHLIDA